MTYLKLAQKVLSELPQFGHVRLDEDAAVERLPPRGRPPQVEPERADQPRGPLLHADVVEVLRDGDGLARVHDHRHDGRGGRAAAVKGGKHKTQEVLDAGGGVAELPVGGIKKRARDEFCNTFSVLGPIYY